MARREVYDCDRCSKKDVPAAPLVVLIGACSDGVGGSDNITAHLDLCPACASACLKIAIETLLRSTSLSANEIFRSMGVRESIL